MPSTNSNQSERLDLEHEVRHVLEEARMIVPGVQALLGFQLVSVFSNTFFVKLGASDHMVHLASICCTSIAMGFVMAPAAFHRQAERGMISQRLVVVATFYLQSALFALAISVGLDTYLIGLMITTSRAGGVLVGSGIGLVLLLLWFGIPFLKRTKP